MVDKLKNILKQPYPLFLEFSKSFPVIVGISLFVPVFLFIFKPFGLTDDVFDSQKLFVIGFGVITFLILSINVYVLPRFFPVFFDEDNWNIGKEITWLLWNVLTGVSAAAIFEFIQPDCPFSFAQLMQGYVNGFLMSIIPVSLVVLLIHMALLKTKLRRAEEINRKLAASDDDKPEETLKFVSETGSETIKLKPADLLFIQSSDNYSTIVWQQNGEAQKIMLRSSLKRLEDQANFPGILRCHRSFIVNLSKVYSVSGNANGYRLYLKKYPEPIPVARRYGRQVLGILEQFAD